ncbi:MAG: GntR family transcriptional regulator [Actinobacteria bacterium]|nr:GntR family transcriptional regulator [Actinomycetota bacterium]
MPAGQIYSSPEEGFGPLRRDTGIPLYIQLQETILGMVEEGRWGPGDALPAEQRIGELTGVSRSVIRQALGELVGRGVLERHQGRGTFVARPRATEAFAGHPVGFYEDMTSRGYRIRTRVVAQRLEPADARIAADLRIAEGDPTVAIIRVRSIDDRPSVHVQSWLPADRFAELVDVDLEDASLYALLRARFGVELLRSHRMVGATVADETLARLLEVEPGAALVQLSSVGYGRDDEPPFESYVAYHVADRTRFELNVERTTDFRELPAAVLPTEDAGARG